MVGAFAASRRTVGRPAVSWAGLLPGCVKRGGFSMESLMAKREPGRSRPARNSGELRLTRRPVADPTEEQMDDAVRGARLPYGKGHLPPDLREQVHLPRL